ncbi:hypothetical protein GCM10010363_76590 [Streptomyces omiyaensis]|nr:hypothetical protein [Streptomyces omiyaensis]GGY85289.1 hypothetical protein GCM10010363_76590 [Streptomyces omiyaensis]
MRGAYGPGTDPYAGRRSPSEPQRALADLLTVRADSPRAEAGRDGEHLSVRDAVTRDAVRLGLARP